MMIKAIVVAVGLCVSSVAVAQYYGDPEQCRSARDDAETAASELAYAARRLQQCAEAEDYSDDCDSEFRRVRSAQDDYESRVSDVADSCED